MEKLIKQADYKRVIEENGVLAFVPGGNSMWPTLKNRKQSVIVVKKEGKLNKYDVALYLRQNGTFVLHRVIEPTEYGYVMCGDSQVTLEKVNEDQVFGVMQGFYRGDRYIECSDEDYKQEVIAWYGDTVKRQRKLKWFYRRQWILNLPKRVINKLFRRKKRNV